MVRIGFVVAFFGWTSLGGAEGVPTPASADPSAQPQPSASANRSFPEPELVAKDPAGHGVLARLEGKTILIVHGSPTEMGRAHGTLLAEKARSLTARVLYMVGGLDTIQSGRWFLDLMDQIHQRTSPFIPKRFFEEIDAASLAAGISQRDGRLANLFPERFHCSGVAVRGKASKDGRVYHARVLDYMRDIHLQQAAVVQVFIPDGYNAWISLGYAGFLGTVTCMNERGLAIGEMGGRGEGDWDGMPMTFLMREIMERASTVEEALEIFRKTPRTCEYYYVLSDKHRNMAAVRATPKELLVLRPGQQHPLLPRVPEDTVFISGDTRAQVLSQRLQEHYGQIDLQRMIQIIKRPVAMASNLHNAIFSPETLEMWVADAGRDTPACDEPYIRVCLPELVQWYRKVNNFTGDQKNLIGLKPGPKTAGNFPDGSRLWDREASAEEDQMIPIPSSAPADSTETKAALKALWEGRFSWRLGPPLVEPVQPEGDICYSVKDPSIVFYQERWHLFCTVRGQKRTHQIEYLSFQDWQEANRARRVRLQNHEGFFCAPEVFYFTPHKKWYLICQASDPSWDPKYGAAFATTENLADPASWSHLKPLRARPADGKAGLDFWIICDDKHAHLFFTTLDGRLWREETQLEDFPHGWSEPMLAIRADIFEAAHVYKIRGMQKYLALIEAQAGHGWRYYKAYLADRLQGPWTPLAAERDRSFASMKNVQHTGVRWTDCISHGELLRCGVDEHLEVEPNNLRFLFQGVLDQERAGKPYGQIPWRLGLLEPDEP